MARERKHPDEPVMIKKYANRRLYNTQTSTYVTLDDLCDLVKEGSEFVVVDAKSGEDLTKSVLTQIIFEQEARGANMLPISFLRSLIGFYDDGIKDFVPHYLESSMQAFMKNQEQMREMMGMGSKTNPMKAFEDLTQQNLDIFSKTMEAMFNPFGDGKKK
ncbi:MAG: polyhydroxyalkanoate synthesis repressor PhaR [Rickettsiales bacterium]|nr:polyhydroxyalkanoate synthesis repressor PhaR [Rickettsiales bacterium]|tara:strand:+ start:160 stop:639 length:480 start_codon:yes stop_codon:yes gene_type:complete